MDWLLQLLAHESVARTVLILAVAIATGTALGKIKVGGVTLGVAGVLFTSLTLGHFGLNIELGVLEFIREFGLILFVYTLGLQIGPGFFALLKSRGMGLNFFAASIVVLGVGVAVLLIKLGRVDAVSGTGLLAGATTNTPSLAAAQQALRQSGAAESAAVILGLGYAVAYPFGIIGIILTMVVVRLIFRIDVRAEVKAAESAGKQSQLIPVTRNFEVRNPNLAGHMLSEIPILSGSGVVVSRVSRGGSVEVARPDTELHPGDIVHAVGPASALEALRLVIGPEAQVDLKAVPGPVVNRRLIVTQASVFGKSIDEVTAFAEHYVVITRVTRGGLQFTPTASLRLQFGDILMAVGEAPMIDAAAPSVGNSPKALDSPQPIPFFLGIALGVLLGSVPLVLPGLPAAVKLGLAGGPLVAAILLSRMATTGPLVWHLPHTANLMLREIGISLFLAAVGLKSGEKFVGLLLGPQGLHWLGYGILITFVPLLVVGIVARGWKKLNYAELCGVLAGSMTDPPALAFAQQHLASDAPAVAYATVYPLTMLLRVFSAQLVIFLLYRAAG